MLNTEQDYFMASEKTHVNRHKLAVYINLGHHALIVVPQPRVSQKTTNYSRGLDETMQKAYYLSL